MSEYVDMPDVELATITRADTLSPFQRLIGLLRKNALLRHNVILLCSTLAGGVFSYLFHPLVGHLLGSVGYGDVLAVISLFGLVATPTQIIGTVFNKFTADLSARGRLDQVSYLLRRSTFYGFAIGIAAAVVLAIASPAVAGFLQLTSPLAIIIMSITLIWALPTTIVNGAIQGREQFGWVGTASFVSIITRIGFTVLFIMIGWGVYGVLWAVVIPGAVAYVLMWWPLRALFRAPAAPLPSLKPLFAYSLTATLGALGGSLLFNVDTILAKHYLSGADAGYYGALVTIGRIVLYVTASASGVMFPKVAALAQRGGNHRAVLGWTLAASFALGGVVVVAFAVFPGHLVDLIFHAPPQVSRLLIWYGVAMLMYALANVLMTYFLSLGWSIYTLLLLGCCALQIGLITIWHSSVGAVVIDMLVVMAALLSSMIALYVIRYFAGRSQTVARVQAEA